MVCSGGVGGCAEGDVDCGGVVEGGCAGIGTAGGGGL